MNVLCAGCGTHFSAKASAKRKYCSAACYHAASCGSSFDLKEWYRRNRSAQNESRRQWALANPEKRRAARKNWQAKNLQRLAIQASLRRTKGRRGASVAALATVLEAAEGFCTYCGLRVERLEIDHVLAVTKGGDGKVGNILPACRSCNASKCDKNAADWVADKFGAEGLARAISMLSGRKMVEALYPGTEIVEARK